LLEDKDHISNNAADHWQQFLHQHHVSAILPVDFSARFNENKVGITEFQQCNIDLKDLMEVGRMCRR